MGISQNAYSKIENNITQVTVNHLKAISVTLDVPVMDLLRDDFEIRKPNHLNDCEINRTEVIIYLLDLQQTIKHKKKKTTSCTEPFWLYYKPPIIFQKVFSSTILRFC